MILKIIDEIDDYVYKEIHNENIDGKNELINSSEELQNYIYDIFSKLRFPMTIEKEFDRYFDDEIINYLDIRYKQIDYGINKEEVFIITLLILGYQLTKELLKQVQSKKFDLIYFEKELN